MGFFGASGGIDDDFRSFSECLEVSKSLFRHAHRLLVSSVECSRLSECSDMSCYALTRSSSVLTYHGWAVAVVACRTRLITLLIS